MRINAVVAAFAAACVTASARGVETLPASYPEGPLWQGERLLFAEMGADRVSSYEAGEREVFFTQRGCGPTAIAPYGDGFVILCHIGARIVATDEQGRETGRWTRDAAGNPLQDPNDAGADGRGGVYFSDPGRFALDAPPHGYVMRLSADGEITRAAGPLRYPNGVHVAGDALYVSEHLARRVLRFPILADGRLGEPQTFARIGARTGEYPLAGPDGLEFGPDDHLYIAVYGEGRILRFSPQGSQAGEVETETQFVTNVAFSRGGALAIVGAYDNVRAPYRGQVLILAPGVDRR